MADNKNLVYEVELSNACTNIVFAKTLRLALDNFEQKNQHIKDINELLSKMFTGDRRNCY